LRVWSRGRKDSRGANKVEGGHWALGRIRFFSSPRPTWRTRRSTLPFKRQQAIKELFMITRPPMRKASRILNSLYARGHKDAGRRLDQLVSVGQRVVNQTRQVVKVEKLDKRLYAPPQRGHRMSMPGLGKLSGPLCRGTRRMRITMRLAVHLQAETFPETPSSRAGRDDIVCPQGHKPVIQRYHNYFKQHSTWGI
jgi:hypothetical protein